MTLIASKKVLIIEDDPDISKALSIRFRAGGYEVGLAMDAVLAMTEAKRLRPDVVILDIGMPGGNGFVVAKRFGEDPDLKDTPIVFLTASKRPEYRERALSLGAAGYFEKPYDAADLLDAVSRIVMN